MALKSESDRVLFSDFNLVSKGLAKTGARAHAYNTRAARVMALALGSGRILFSAAMFACFSNIFIPVDI